MARSSAILRCPSAALMGVSNWSRMAGSVGPARASCIGRICVGVHRDVTTSDRSRDGRHAQRIASATNLQSCTCCMQQQTNRRSRLETGQIGRYSIQGLSVQGIGSDLLHRVRDEERGRDAVADTSRADASLKSNRRTHAGVEARHCHPDLTPWGGAASGAMKWDAPSECLSALRMTSSVRSSPVHPAGTAQQPWLTLYQQAAACTWGRTCVTRFFCDFIKI